MNDLSVKIGKLTFKNPILTASGTFGYGQEYSSFFDLNKLGGLVTKTITLEPRAGNPFPRIAETASGMLNSIGLANVGVDAFIEEKLPFLRTLKTNIIVNVAGSTEQDYADIIKILEQSDGIDGYEINVSCPNVKEGGIAFGANADITARITEKIKSLTNRCVIIKLTPNVTSIGSIAKVAEQAGADAVSLINTLIGMAVDVHTRKPKIARITAGLSGPAIKPVALAKVFEVANTVQIPIIGIGGIMNYEDVLEFMITGATAIQLGTVNYIEPDACIKILENLDKYCTKNKIKQITNIISSLVINNA